MELKKLRENWNTFGQKDPLWAILTEPTKKGNKWELDEFFQTGKKEISDLIKYLNEREISFSRSKALDFGCGVGRLTQALSDEFEEVHGVDIAESMISQAKKYNKHKDRCHYHVNVKEDLMLFDGNNFSFVYTNIVLQHMKPVYAKKYIKEFLRILSQEGVLVFQLPSEPINKSFFRSTLKKVLPSFIFNAYVKWKDGLDAIIEMYCIEKNEVLEFLKENNAEVLDVTEDISTGDDWLSFRYVVQLKTNKD